MAGDCLEVPGGPRRFPGGCRASETKVHQIIKKSTILDEIVSFSPLSKNSVPSVILRTLGQLEPKQRAALFVWQIAEN